MSANGTRNPPSDDAAEVAVLASVLMDPGCIAKIRLVTDDFYVERHRAVWGAITALTERSIPPDPVMVVRELERRGSLEDAGGRDAFGAIVAATSHPAHAEHYANIVAEKARQRRLIYALANVTERIHGGEDSRDAARAIEEALASVTKSDTTGVFLAGAQVLNEEATVDTDWYVECLLPRNAVSLLCSEPKAGKTTLIASLIAALQRGGTCIGMDCQATRGIIYLSEESVGTLRLPLKRAGVSPDGIHFLTRQHMDAMPWDGAIQSAIAMAQQPGGPDLLIVDTWSAWAGLLGDQENSAGHVEHAMRPLKRAATAGLTVLATHHLAKSPDRKGAAAVRGSGALAGAVDGFVLLRRDGGEDSPVRSLWGTGRGEGWAHGLRYEMDADGSLRRLEGRQQAAAAQLAPKIVDAMKATGVPMTGSEVHEALGGRRADVMAALKELAHQGRIRDTAGSKGEGSRARWVLA